MIVERIHDNIRYTLSNKNLKNNDKVFQLAEGRCVNKKFILHSINFYCRHIKDFNISGFPNNPLTILNIKYSNNKVHEVSTTRNWGPKEIYFKIIKKEKYTILGWQEF